MVLFLDAEKAFNKVNWQFVPEQLKMMDAGGNFIKVIQAIYTNQKAR